MNKKKLKKLIEEDLENIFHNNENAEKYKAGLVFNHIEKPKLTSTKKFKFAMVFSMLAIFLIGGGAIYTATNYEKIFFRNQAVTDDDLQKEAEKLLSKSCDNYILEPIKAINFDEYFYLNIFNGMKYDEEKNSDEHLYFYQFGNYKKQKMDCKLDFYINDKHEVIDNITSNVIDQLTINEGEEITGLSVDIYDHNELIGNYLLF